MLLFNTNDEEPTDDVILTDIDSQNVHTIEVTRNQSNNILFKKEAGTWFMQSPYHLPANPVRINTILGLLRAHSYTQFDKNEPELHRFKLDMPEVSIRFNDLQIDFGDTSPLGEQRYVLTNNTVHMINDSLFQQLKAPATFFLDNSLLHPGSEITAITFPDYAITQQNGVWKIAPETSVSGDDIVKLVEAWKFLGAVSISSYEPGEEPSGTIKVESANHDAVVFAIISPPPQLILARTDLGIQYHISGDDSEKLFLQPKTSQEPAVNN